MAISQSVSQCWLCHLYAPLPSPCLQPNRTDICCAYVAEKIMNMTASTMRR